MMRPGPSQPAGKPPAHLVPAAKSKPLLVPKAEAKPPSAHLAEQKRRMEWVRLYKAAEEDVNSLGQVAFKVAKKVDGFDGSGTPDPFNQNDDDPGDEAASGSQGVWAGEVWGILDEEDDDSLVQGASKVAKKGEGFDGSGTPDPFNQNDDDQGEEDPDPFSQNDDDQGEEDPDPFNQNDDDQDADFDDFLKIVPTKFLLRELAQRCTR
jgi:hypothetical protein